MEHSITHYGQAGTRTIECNASILHMATGKRVQGSCIVYFGSHKYTNDLRHPRKLSRGGKHLTEQDSQLIPNGMLMLHWQVQQEIGDFLIFFFFGTNTHYR